MAKWKCEICGNEFDNFHAQGFDNKIYCPLCYFKKENQELKKQLHEASLTIQEMTEQDIECPSNCEKLRQLKKQLEEYKKLGFKHLQDKNNILETQQKAFIKFLENELLDARYYARDIAHFIEYVLQKYKKLIGVSDEKEN